MSNPRRIDWIGPVAGRWPARTRALTTTRRPPAGGCSAPPFDALNLADHVGDDPRAVAANRAWLQAQTGLREIQWLTQIHGSRCIEANARTLGRAPEADAAWTAQPGLALGILTADCVPVVIADREGVVVGVAHGGWRGLVGGVLEALVCALPVPAQRLCAWIGPAIGPEAYEIGEDVAAAVRAVDRAVADTCLRAGRRPGKHQLDLFALTEALLARAGVAVLPGARTCTYSDARFYSYRRDGQTGRMATVAWLAEV